MPTVRPQIFQTGPATTITPPEGSQAGDLLLAFLSYESVSWAATLTGGTPEWEPLVSKATTSAGTSTLGTLASGIWWKPASNGETSWALATGGGVEGTYMVMAVIAVTGALLQAPLYTVSGDQTSTTSGSPITTVSSPAGPAPALGDLELRWVGGDNFPTSAMRTWTASSPTVEVADISASYVAAQLTRQDPPAGSSASRTHTVSDGIYAGHGFTLRIRPPAVTAASVLAPTGAARRAASW